MRIPLVLLALLLPLPVRGDDAKDILPEAKAVLAQLKGDVSLVGLREPVEVLRDRWGFVAAQDRLFQMDMWRRQGTGETAEVLGPTAVDADRFARLIRFRGDMELEWASYSPDTKRIAVAFTGGINAFIDQAAGKLPIEFQMLGMAPKKWRPEDVLGRMSGIYMSQNFRNEVLRAQLVAAVGADKARRLAPVDPPRAYGPAPGLDLTGIDQRVLAGYTAALKLLQHEPPKTESNNWVVAGSRSVSGKPLLASDPHRAIALPSLRYLVHLYAPGWNVIGSGEPGLPGVAIGHNEHIAWGITIVGTDQADIYVEETNPNKAREYRVGERWEKMTVVHETLHVKGEGKPRAVELRFTRHGPVLFEDPSKLRAFALKWAGSEPGGAAYLGSLAVDRAGNVKEFLQALGSWKVPGLNFVYADRAGTIGWVAAALTPVRKNHDGLLPVPGAGGFEWQGYLPVAELPQRFNPKGGFVATANHNILPEKYAHGIGYEFAPPYRYQRVKDRLAAKEKWNLADFRAIQHDDLSLPGVALGRLLKTVPIEDKALETYVRLLAEWDGRLTIDSRAGPLYAAWLKELQDAFYAPHAPKELKGALATLSGLPVMLEALENPSELWFGSEPAASRDRLVRATFARAVEKAKKLPQRWGALHTVTFRHPLGSPFHLGPVERPSDGNAPNNTRYDDKFQQIHGATYRQLFDLADWDRALATSAPGQSGQPGSPHYADLLPLWASADYFPLAYSRAKVEEVTSHRLTLRPR
jgi:penicillin amidase